MPVGILLVLYHTTQVVFFLFDKKLKGNIQSRNFHNIPSLIFEEVQLWTLNVSPAHKELVNTNIMYTF